MDASEVLAKAWQAVVTADLPPEIHETAFKAAIELIAPGPRLSAPAPRPAPSPAAQPSPQTADEGTANEPVSGEDLFLKLAQESGVDQTALEQVFYFDEGGAPHINAPGRKLGSNTAVKARAIVTGLAAVNYFVHDQPTSSMEAARAESQAKSAYDKKNFATSIASAPGVTVSGSGTARVLRVKSTEIEAAFRAMVNKAIGIQD